MLHFSHDAHVARNIGCAQCHDDVERTTEHTIGKRRPDMRRCLSCHGMAGPARGDAKSGCPVCHVTEKNGLLTTRFTGRTSSGSVTTRVLVPPVWLHDAAHGPDFTLRHKRIAADDSAFCAACHAERFCTDCHDGRVRPRDVHPGDWLSMHPMAARQNAPVCSSCHAEQSFCLDCHAWAGVSEVGAAARGRRFHPAGWSSLGTTRGPGHHAWEAQRNLHACVSCHTERDCALCHASTGRRGLGIDPHPAGFARGCRAQLARNRRPCLVCHEPGSAELSRCY
jgi:hypothetical protein